MTDPVATTATPTTPAPVTPGRVVLVRLGDGLAKGQVRPGIVIRRPNGIDEPMTINVAVMVEGCDDFGHELGGAGVQYCKALPYDQSGSIDGSWAWMPYQQGQAAKSDTEVAALRAELSGVKSALDALITSMASPAAGSNSG